MKLVIEFDPWCDRPNATRAAQALATLGMPAELREVRPRRPGSRIEDSEPVKLQSVVDVTDMTSKG
jgi:hypothetical protein